MRIKSTKQIAKLIVRASKKHAPEILVGSGIIGLVTAIFTAVHETPIAEERIEEATEQKGEKLTVQEKAKTIWKVYLPTAILAIVSVACIVFASTVNLKRNAALAAAYSLAESSISDLELRHMEDVKLMKKNGITPPEQKNDAKDKPVGQPIVVINKGEEMFIEPLGGGIPFSSSKADIRNAVARMNTEMANSFCGSLSLNEYLFGLYGGNIDDAGDDKGWNPSRNGRMIDIEFIPDVDKNGGLVWKIVHRNPPFHDFI